MMREKFFVVSKENLEIAIDEIIALAKTYDRFARIKVYSNLVLVQTKTSLIDMQKRATYVRNSGEIIKKLSDLFSDQDNTCNILEDSSTFACRVLNLSSKNKGNSLELESSMGNLISKNSNAQVSLYNPDLMIYNIFTKKQNFFGFSTKTKKMKRPKKSKTHPNQLDWKLSRAMINLCRLKEKQVVCDPFCGTGTTLLEAETMGIRGIGIDFNKEMSEMAKKNMQDNKFLSKIINADFSYFTKIIDEIDGIVTDVPYGKNSKISKKPEKIIIELLEKLPKEKKFAIMCKKGFENEINLKNVKRYQIYRHKSLTRIILVK